MHGVGKQRGKKMDDLSFELSSPITEEQWDMITDVDFDNTNEITFHTKHGKEVKFVKAQPNLQPTCNQLATDTISRQAVMWRLTNLSYTQCKTQGEADVIDTAKTMVITMPSAQPETCDTCKHGYFGDTQCDNCCVRYPSHYERRTDEQTD